jgi:hypothetical protein
MPLDQPFRTLPMLLVFTAVATQLPLPSLRLRVTKQLVMNYRIDLVEKGIDADIRRSMTDFSVTGMAKDAQGEARKVAVESMKSVPADFLPKLGIEATKESTKFHDWEDKAKDGGWRTWRDLGAEEEEKQEEERKEANGG